MAKKKKKDYLYKDTKPYDIVQIVPSCYDSDYPIGQCFVAIGVIDRYDVEIINDKGEFDILFGEEYEVIGNALTAKQEADFPKKEGIKLKVIPTT